MQGARHPYFNIKKSGTTEKGALNKWIAFIS
jgi:hypothetical protein